jgi:UDP-N-acetylglucosamine 2-epimerase (non-hydrolysing)
VKIVSVVGARPEFVQVAVLSQLLRRRHHEVLVHTGQHYDERMSDSFFEQLGIPQPDVNLGTKLRGSSAQTAEMLARLAEVIAAENPDLVIVRGDTNSTLAGALAAKQLLLPLAHIEAGMRSYDRTMPEELNRVIADHISDIELVTDEDAAKRLAAEGIRENVHVCGDVMYDVFLRAREQARASLGPRLTALAAEPYDLLTLHRAENTDDRERLRAIVGGFSGAPRRIIFPVHPRTAARLEEFGLTLPAAITPIEPLGYLDIIALECGARAIYTDSGGVQREAYFAHVPCVTLRDTTEWTNTVDAGWNRLVGADANAIRTTLHAQLERPEAHPLLFGSGDAAQKIVAALETPATGEIIARARMTRAKRGYATSTDERVEARTTTDASMR